MVKIEAHVRSKYGIHARPAEAICIVACSFEDTEIHLIDPYEDIEVNAKSIMNILNMSTQCGEKIIVVTKGDQEQEAAEAVAKVINEFEVS